MEVLLSYQQSGDLTLVTVAPRVSQLKLEEPEVDQLPLEVDQVVDCKSLLPVDKLLQSVEFNWLRASFKSLTEAMESLPQQDQGLAAAKPKTAKTMAQIRPQQILQIPVWMALMEGFAEALSFNPIVLLLFV